MPRQEHQPKVIGSCTYPGCPNELLSCRDWEKVRWKYPFSDSHNCTLVPGDHLYPEEIKEHAIARQYRAYLGGRV